jgi:hypothetical protein
MLFSLGPCPPWLSQLKKTHNFVSVAKKQADGSTKQVLCVTKPDANVNEISVCIDSCACVRILL